MVSAGWALAYTAYSDQYVDVERRAARAASAFTRIAASPLGSGGR